MVEIDYIFEEDYVRDACQRQNLISDYSVADWEMLMRFRVGDVEVFGQTEEEYQRWLERLRSYHLALNPPSSAWSTLSVLSIAVSVSAALRSLREVGQAELPSLDSIVRLTQEGGVVTVCMRPDRIGQAPYAEMHEALQSFEMRVRRDFLSACPQLSMHVSLGWWFRGETPSAPSEQPQNTIIMPVTFDNQ